MSRSASDTGKFHCVARDATLLCQRVAIAVVVLLLAACTGAPPARFSAERIAPLQLPDTVLTVDQVAARVPSPDLLALDQEMRDFVARYAGSQRHDRGRLLALHSAVKGAGVLDMEYDPFAEGSASETFHRGTANCLSYANLFVALAREAGLDADYQWQQVRPQWSRLGERVAVGLHVNAVVKLRNGEQYQADIDPLQSREVTGSRLLSEAQALALYHSNIAMAALAVDDVELAWLQAVRALQLAPGMTHLWVNLGAVYRRAGQHREAENAYLYALSRDAGDRSAMNNLVVLYDMEGREAERDYWRDRVARYRESNPFFHAWRGDQAGEQQLWAEALTHYQRALDLRPDDSHLLYAVGLLHYRLEDYARADAFITRAIEGALLRSDKESYQLQLDAVRKAALAVH